MLLFQKQCLGNQAESSQHGGIFITLPVNKYKSLVGQKKSPNAFPELESKVHDTNSLFKGVLINNEYT